MSQLIKSEGKLDQARVLEVRPPEKTPPPDERKIDLRHYYLVLLKRKWQIAAVALTVMILAGVQAYTTTARYTAVARIQIDPEEANVLPYQDFFQASLYTLASEAYLRTQAENLRSRSLATKVVAKMNLVDDPVFNSATSRGLFWDLAGSGLNWLQGLFVGSPTEAAGEVSPPERSPEDLADAFRARIDVRQVRGTRHMEVSYTHQDAELAARIANVLVTEFIEHKFEQKAALNQSAKEFLTDRHAELEERVKTADNELRKFADEHDILVDLNDGDNIVTQRLAALNQDRTEVETRLAAASARFVALQNATVDDFPVQLKTDRIESLEQKLSELEQEFARIQATYAPEWQGWKEKEQEIETVSKQLRLARQQAIDQNLSEMETIKNERDNLATLFEQQRARAKRLNQTAAQYNILKKNRDAAEDLFEGVLQRLKQATVSATLRSSNIQVVDTARTPTFASYPPKRRNLSLGLLLGLFLGVGLAYLIEYLDNTIKTPDDVEQFLGLPTLAVVPSLSENRTRRLTGAVKAEKSLVANSLQFPKSQIWEAYRSLRTSILLSHSGRPPKTILVSSALPGEGKTTTSLHTAMVLAQTGARTLVMDLDMRKPTLARAIGIDGSIGMSNYLSGNSDLSSQIQQAGVPNLFFLAAGPHPPNPAELIGSERMERCLSLLAEYFQYIVIDSPPIMSVTDALILANQVDGVVLVVHGGKTPKEIIRRATDRLRRVGARILGGMINNVDIRKSEYSYYYSYYYYDDYSAETPRSKAG